MCCLLQASLFFLSSVPSLSSRIRHLSSWEAFPEALKLICPHRQTGEDCAVLAHSRPWPHAPRGEGQVLDVELLETEALLSHTGVILVPALSDV